MKRGFIITLLALAFSVSFAANNEKKLKVGSNNYIF